MEKNEAKILGNMIVFSMYAVLSILSALIVTYSTYPTTNPEMQGFEIVVLAIIGFSSLFLVLTNSNKLGKLKPKTAERETL